MTGLLQRFFTFEMSALDDLEVPTGRQRFAGTPSGGAGRVGRPSTVTRGPSTREQWIRTGGYESAQGCTTQRVPMDCWNCSIRSTRLATGACRSALQLTGCPDAVDRDHQAPRHNAGQSTQASVHPVDFIFAWLRQSIAR